MFSQPNFDVFFRAKNPKIFKCGKIRKDDEERERFEKNGFIFLEGIFSKMRGQKTCRK